VLARETLPKASRRSWIATQSYGGLDTALETIYTISLGWMRKCYKPLLKAILTRIRGIVSLMPLLALVTICKCESISLSSTPIMHPPPLSLSASPPARKSPIQKLSTGYPQIWIEVIHNCPNWFNFAFQFLPVCNAFFDFDLT